MRIEKISISHVSLPLQRPLRTSIHSLERVENVLVEIEADGTQGVGYAFVFESHQARAVGCMVEDLTEDLVGNDPTYVRDHWRRLWDRLNWVGQTGLGLMALSAVDTALWDLLAKEAGLPLFRLLGAVRDEVPLYGSGGFVSYSRDEVVEEALSFRDRGFGYYKMKIGADKREGVERVQALIEELDGSMQVMVDANQSFSVHDAEIVGKELETRGAYWFEEPVDVHDFDGSARVAKALAIPLASGETVSGVPAFKAFIDKRAADIVMPDLMRVGGPTGFMQVATLAASANLPVSPHLLTEVSAHLVAACPSGGLVEYLPGWWDEMLVPPPQIVEGRMVLPDEPGLGFGFSEEAKRRFVVGNVIQTG